MGFLGNALGKIAGGATKIVAKVNDKPPPPPPTNWTTSPLACAASPCALIVQSCCFPCCAAATTNALLEGEINEVPESVCCQDQPFADVACSCCISTYMNRRRLRRLLNVRGTAEADLCWSAFCMPCTEMQMQREIKTRGMTVKALPAMQRVETQAQGGMWANDTFGCCDSKANRLAGPLVVCCTLGGPLLFPFWYAVLNW
jgi:Cys-rich protein (TIGR01571 family)